MLGMGSPCLSRPRALFAPFPVKYRRLPSLLRTVPRGRKVRLTGRVPRLLQLKTKGLPDSEGKFTLKSSVINAYSAVQVKDARF